MNMNTNSITPIVYPTSSRDETIDYYFGIGIEDPYRWLEDDQSEQTEAWVTAQNNTTQNYLDNITYLPLIEQRLTTLFDYEKISAPFDEGQYTYFYKNDGLQNHSVLYQQNRDGQTRIFLDPNTFSSDGTTSLSSIRFSQDGSLAAYSISEGGSDWRKIITIDTTTLKTVGETLMNVKFSGIAWKNNEGFFYSSYDKPQGSKLSAKTDQHKLYYHQLNTPQSEDQLIFGGTEAEKHRYVRAYTTEDGQHLLISASTSTSGNKLFALDLTTAKAKLMTVLDTTTSDTYLVDSDNQYFYFRTNLDAPNGRLVRAKRLNPGPQHWIDIIPENQHVLRVSSGGGYLFAHYLIDTLATVQQFTRNGQYLRDIKLPGLGTALGFSGKDGDKTLYYGFTNYNTPSTIYRFDVNSGEAQIYRQSEINFDHTPYTSEQVFFTSKDGTKVPMMITYKKNLALDGKNPTLLYGYGGFNSSLLPRFSSAMAFWLEQGGIYAVPNIRGGGEYGKQWHIAATKMQKQNSFDDFIAAAEYLVDKKYTSPDYLAIRGGSNGGLLVGAVMTQRPELFKVAIPEVGVLDMLRYHKFTAGAGWAKEYGTADESKAMFNYLKAYSPLHNIRPNTHYPATLITTADHDDRVVPSHSFKFAAELQSKQTGSHPTLIRIETNAGHGAGKPLKKTLKQYADIFGFTLFNMGISHLE